MHSDIREYPIELDTLLNADFYRGVLRLRRGELHDWLFILFPVHYISILEDRESRCGLPTSLDTKRSFAIDSETSATMQLNSKGEVTMILQVTRHSVDRSF